MLFSDPNSLSVEIIVRRRLVRSFDVSDRAMAELQSVGRSFRAIVGSRPALSEAFLHHRDALSVEAIYEMAGRVRTVRFHREARGSN